jgi:hypothetical protein
MAAEPKPKKYIIDNPGGSMIQTIYGNLNIEGVIKSNNIGKYRALLTQTRTIVGSSIASFNNGLIIGETYTITDYQEGDDFSNIAQITTGNHNENGCVFIAKGENPSSWEKGTELTSNGNLVVDVLENTLGYDLTWLHSPLSGEGYYIAFNSDSISEEGPLLNQFPRNKTDIKVGNKYPFDFLPTMNGLIPIGIPGIGNMFSKDSYIYIEMYYDGEIIDNSLYYTPVEITINQDLDIKPMDVYGLNISEFRYGNASVRLFSGTNEVVAFYNNSYNEVNNMEELISVLNSDTGTNIIGEYSLNPDIENGIILTIASNLKNQLSPDSELTFEVFND